ncbi:hypothetical protein T09_5717 [Trichinella sp. T9]|nr:hypothetical protein T09_5717 [Trichinella sp. T9]
MDTTVPFRLGYSQRVARDSVVVANSSWHQGVSNVASQTSDALSQSKRYSVAILTATVLSGHCGAAECFSVTSKMAAIKQRLATPGFALRLRPRANKNLHIPSGYASGILLQHICPRGRFMQIFNHLEPQALPSGYAPGQIKICIFPQAMPQAFYCTIFALRATPQAMPQAIFRKFRNFSKIAPGFALRLRPRANKNLHIPSGYASGDALSQSKRYSVAILTATVLRSVCNRDGSSREFYAVTVTALLARHFERKVWIAASSILCNSKVRWMSGWSGCIFFVLHLGFNGLVLNPEFTRWFQVSSLDEYAEMHRMIKSQPGNFRYLMGGIKRECSVMRECKLQIMHCPKIDDEHIVRGQIILQRDGHDWREYANFLSPKGNMQIFHCPWA